MLASGSATISRGATLGSAHRVTLLAESPVRTSRILRAARLLGVAARTCSTAPTCPRSSTMFRATDVLIEYATTPSC